ncbi:MAG: ParB/RepB/Spo0J family partition protein, partial [Alphaproteobacteria bacterium]
MAVSPDSSRPVDDATPAEAEGGASPRPDTPEEHGRLSAEAEDAARRAAEATGLPLGAWLSRVIQSAGDVPAGTRSEGSQEGPFGPRAVPIHSLRPGRFQTRESVTPEEIQVLAESIRERGVLQPILVREHPAEPGVFEIVAGERRWRGAREAGLEHVPVIVLDLDDRGAMEVALVENLQR